MGVEFSRLKMGGSGWEWVEVSGSEWEWMGVSGSGWEWVGARFSITPRIYFTIFRNNFFACLVEMVACKACICHFSWCFILFPKSKALLKSSKIFVPWWFRVRYCLLVLLQIMVSNYVNLKILNTRKSLVKLFLERRISKDSKFDKLNFVILRQKYKYAWYVITYLCIKSKIKANLKQG